MVESSVIVEQDHKVQYNEEGTCLCFESKFFIFYTEDKRMRELKEELP